ncbi:Myb- protein A [Modicella reniformis]|uniref:Myb- protein A n=1 Tax=Modicella reniformis TaxID=1440133 RepID=A0A9P6MBJ3_9FUNG|nr:Myb- protein A [Modicella reniformis]
MDHGSGMRQVWLNASSLAGSRCGTCVCSRHEEKCVDHLLNEAVNTFGTKAWKSVADYAFPDGSRDRNECMHRWRVLFSIKPRQVKGPWTEEEDRKLRDLVNEYGPEKWVFIASRIGTRTVNKSPFTHEEDMTILQLYSQIGSKWAEMAKRMPGRPDNSIKNHFNTTMQRKKRRMSMPSIHSGYHLRDQSQDNGFSTSPRSHTQLSLGGEYNKRLMSALSPPITIGMSTHPISMARFMPYERRHSLPVPPTMVPQISSTSPLGSQVTVPSKTLILPSPPKTPDVGRRKNSLSSWSVTPPPPPPPIQSLGGYNAMQTPCGSSSPTASSSPRTSSQVTLPGISFFILACEQRSPLLKQLNAPVLSPLQNYSRQHLSSSSCSHLLASSAMISEPSVSQRSDGTSNKASFSNSVPCLQSTMYPQFRLSRSAYFMRSESPDDSFMNLDSSPSRGTIQMDSIIDEDGCGHSVKREPSQERDGHPSSHIAYGDITHIRSNMDKLYSNESISLTEDEDLDEDDFYDDDDDDDDDDEDSNDEPAGSIGD